MSADKTPMFDENALGKEIARVWGEHGAHAEVYSMLRRENARLREALQWIVTDAVYKPPECYAMPEFTTRWVECARAALNGGHRE